MMAVTGLRMAENLLQAGKYLRYVYMLLIVQCLQCV